MRQNNIYKKQLKEKNAVIIYIKNNLKRTRYIYLSPISNSKHFELSNWTKPDINIYRRQKLTFFISGWVCCGRFLSRVL